MNDLEKLAYAYGSLMEKTASNEQSEAYYKALNEDREAGPLGLYAKGKSLKGYLDKEKNRSKLLQRGAIAGLGGVVSGGIGAMGANEARARLLRAGMREDEVDDVLTAGGGALRTVGSSALGALSGAGLGYAAGRGINHLIGGGGIDDLDTMLAGLGGVGGAAYGTMRGYEDELERADEALSKREYDKLVRAAKANRSKKR